ncbi:Puromycin-sensitive aminopeptidase [Camellia lanceoleosa]|uniref:Puromycin-sensitive aminopeptidase n=1 Tax=Camellia lanceoleosa TaxID=1840588 RepID=A0ACC0GT84_9ERIC|nr:Puromycin-sensitive aminopeptidase [Camellia lanceoleosa]
MVFGLEYDLDLFNIVVVPDSNMGAMESKGLNIFNSKLVLVSPETATDADYVVILGAIGHEKSRNTLMRLLPKLMAYFSIFGQPCFHWASPFTMIYSTSVRIV